MRVYTCNDHEGHWPVPVASVVVAPDVGEARRLLREELKKRGFTHLDFTLTELPLTHPRTRVLSDGDY